MNQIACPACGTIYGVTLAAVPQSFTCQNCQRTVIVPAASAGSSQPYGHVPPPPGYPPAGEQSSVPQQGTLDAGFSIPSGGPAASSRLRKKYKKSSGVLGMFVSLLVGTVLAVGAFGGIFYAYRTHPEWFHRQETIIVEDKFVTSDSATGVKHQWSDATTKTVVKDGVGVRVARVEFGPVRGKDARNMVRDTGSAPFLQVHLVIRNQRDGNVQYTSWYGNEFTIGDGKTAAALSDNLGNAYSMMVFGDIKSIEGQTPSTVLAAGEECTDVIIYEVPPKANERAIDFMRLQLPAAATGGRDFFRFVIPKSMAVNF